MAKKREGAIGTGGGPAVCVCEFWRVCVSRATQYRTEKVAPLEFLKSAIIALTLDYHDLGAASSQQKQGILSQP
ncbi:hypothetical protein QQF64_014386 [Cirrhinus molitorella]|uniref:Uncharacterized protein n=1 Tax=Cirrhinus molitorella TaxID=172907 RepID=A0ABR3NT77_9TELE